MSNSTSASAPALAPHQSTIDKGNLPDSLKLHFQVDLNQANVIDKIQSSLDYDIVAMAKEFVERASMGEKLFLQKVLGGRLSRGPGSVIDYEIPIASAFMDVARPGTVALDELDARRMTERLAELEVWAADAEAAAEKERVLQEELSLAQGFRDIIARFQGMLNETEAVIAAKVAAGASIEPGPFTPTVGN